jgi:hypothetical protein
MAKADSRSTPQPLSRARALLADPRPLDSPAAVLAAAAFFAVTALGLAAMVIAMPPHWS